MNIGDNLLKYRIQQKKSQQDIADLLNVERITYNNWEKNKTKVKADYIPQLAKILDVNIEDLFRKERDIEIIQQHNEGKDSSILNGAILILTDQKIIKDLMNIIEEKFKK